MLYEVLLRFPDREEVRLTDKALAIGQTTSIGGYEWTVTATETPGSAEAETRFVLEPRFANRPAKPA